MSNPVPCSATVDRTSILPASHWQDKNPFTLLRCSWGYSGLKVEMQGELTPKGLDYVGCDELASLGNALSG
jgi:hypothetical protein